MKLYDEGVYLIDGEHIISAAQLENMDAAQARAAYGPSADARIDRPARAKDSIARRILDAHDESKDEGRLALRFDALTSHDITYVGIVQTALASGLDRFPVPYVLTNCHNSLCAVGGTINEDDHVFGLSAAKRYGGVFVPAHLAVIHQYAREYLAACGRMVLGSDSHTRYGALGTMGVGEGGPELVKQLLGRTYDAARPDIVAVVLRGSPKPGVGPQDVALALIGKVFGDGFVQNKVLEFVGPGVENLSVDYRIGIDVMTTEAACLTSIWKTDEKVRDFYNVHGRPESYRALEPGSLTYYDAAIEIDLDKVRPMIALPFHPSNAYAIEELNENAADILALTEREGARQLGAGAPPFKLLDKLEGGRLKVDQAVIAGCSGGTYENLWIAAQMLKDKGLGSDDLWLSAYPASQPVYLEMIRSGAAQSLLTAGVTIRSAFCGPCFGAGDVPAHGALSIRHTTRNFPNREGSSPGQGQLASVALMDARSITATALNGGILTPATDVDCPDQVPEYHFDDAPYRNRVYQGFGKPDSGVPLHLGPNIRPWPDMDPLPEHLALYVASVIRDPVTTTDELIPSGETSSYRSNPYKLAEFTLSRKDPAYVGRAKAAQAAYEALKSGDMPADVRAFAERSGALGAIGVGSVVYANCPGDGSAREQAASCQKVLGGWANIALRYATKRYRSNLINWGMLPFIAGERDTADLQPDDLVFIPDVRKALLEGWARMPAFVRRGQTITQIELGLPGLSPDERDILLAGCLINHYRSN